MHVPVVPAGVGPPMGAWRHGATCQRSGGALAAGVHCVEAGARSQCTPAGGRCPTALPCVRGQRMAAVTCLARRRAEDFDRVGDRVVACCDAHRAGKLGREGWVTGWVWVWGDAGGCVSQRGRVALGAEEPALTPRAPAQRRQVVAGHGAHAAVSAAAIAGYTLPEWRPAVPARPCAAARCMPAQPHIPPWALAHLLLAADASRHKLPAKAATRYKALPADRTHTHTERWPPGTQLWWRRRKRTGDTAGAAALAATRNANAAVQVSSGAARAAHAAGCLRAEAAQRNDRPALAGRTLGPPTSRTACKAGPGPARVPLPPSRRQTRPAKGRAGAARGADIGRAKLPSNG